MTARAFELLLLRPARVGNVLHLAHEIVAAPAQLAAELLAKDWARLVEPRDLPALHRALVGRNGAAPQPSTARRVRHNSA